MTMAAAISKCKYNWAEIEPLLIATYEAGGSVTELARRTGVPKRSLIEQARRLRSRGELHVYRYRPWTEEEVSVLLKQRPYQTYECIGNNLGRSGDAVGVKASELGIGSSDYSAIEIAEAVGCSGETVSRWIKGGHLRARHNKGKAGGRRYAVSEAALRDFFLRCPEKWQHYPCPGQAWIDGIITMYAPRQRA